MSALIDESNNTIDPESEVKKLQDLVKKLETQNQLLRNKQNDREKQNNENINVVKSTKQDGDILDHRFTSANLQTSPGLGKLNDGLIGMSLEEVDLIDVETTTSDEEEDSW